MNTEYDYGRSTGLLEAAITVGRAAVEAEDPAVRDALAVLRETLVETAERVRAEAVAAEDLQAQRLAAAKAVTA